MEAAAIRSRRFDVSKRIQSAYSDYRGFPRRSAKHGVGGEHEEVDATPSDKFPTQDIRQCVLLD